MDIGIQGPFGSPYATPEFMTRLAQEAEVRGFESIWMGEHVVTFDGDAPAGYRPDREEDRERLSIPPMLEPLMTLAYIAAKTTKLRLGTGVLILPQRNPLVTAYQVANLDWLSKGRVEVGVGLNWSQREFGALQVPWAERGARADEYIQILRQLWENDPSSYEGRFYSFPECHMFPKPIQKPLRIHVAGNSDPALRRVARLGQGWYALSLPPEQFAERVAGLDRILAEEGRERSELQIGMLATSPGDPLPDEKLIASYAELGLNRLVVTIHEPTIDGAIASLDELARHIN